MTVNAFKLYPLDSDVNDLSSEVSMFGVADYNPSINDTSRYVFPHNYLPPLVKACTLSFTEHN